MNLKFSTQKNKKGQGLVEYSLLSGLLGLVVVSVLMAFGPEIKVIALSLTDSVSGGYRVESGQLIPPGQIASSTPVNSSTPTVSSSPIASPTSTISPAPTASPSPTASLIPITPSTPFLTFTPIVIVSSTPNILACISGSATVANESACSALSASNNCQNHTFKRWNGRCTWG